MNRVFSRSARRDPFVYPVHPAPRTAVLVPWFQESRLASRPLRVFSDGWNAETETFAPAAIAGTFEQLNGLADRGVHSVTHAEVVLWRPGQTRLSESDRDKLWCAFHVPVFEQVIANSGMLLAAECEAHDGLHIESPSLPVENESLDQTACPCGRKTPRIGVTSGAVLERRMAAYAR